MKFWIFLLGIFVLWIIWNLIGSIARWIAENRKYHEILRESMNKVRDIDLVPYQRYLVELEKLYETTIKTEKVVLKDKKGKVINICPKCGGYMKIARGWRGPFLGCSNYPNCRSYGDYHKIFDLEI